MKVTKKRRSETLTGFWTSSTTGVVVCLFGVGCRPIQKHRPLILFLFYNFQIAKMTRFWEKDLFTVAGEKQKKPVLQVGAFWDTLCEETRLDLRVPGVSWQCEAHEKREERVTTSSGLSPITHFRAPFSIISALRCEWVSKLPLRFFYFPTTHVIMSASTHELSPLCTFLQIECEAFSLSIPFPLALGKGVSAHLG